MVVHFVNKIIEKIIEKINEYAKGNDNCRH
jgi:hypothetical protein